MMLAGLRAARQTSRQTRRRITRAKKLLASVEIEHELLMLIAQPVFRQSRRPSR